jgi:ParD-like antitoxin of type II bacterial toxin-antitoxin system
MSQPVKLSDALVLDARIAGDAQERSIAGQVEFWAKLGRSVELMLNGQQVMALRRNAGARPLSEALAAVDSPEGRKRVADVLARQPFPHYKQHSGQPGLLVRIDEDGTETIGRFVNRSFVTLEASAGLTRKSIARIKIQNSKKYLKAKAVSVQIKEKSAPHKKEREAWA